MHNKRWNIFVKRAFIIYPFFLFPLFASSQKQETREVKIFSKISVEDRMIAVLRKDILNKVVIDAKKEDAWTEEIHAKSDGKELRITSERNSWDGDILCYVHYNQSLTFLDADGGGLIRTDSGEVLETKKLEISTATNGMVNLNVKVDELVINAGSGSDIYIRGFAEKVKVYGTTGAKVHLEDLECNDAEATSIMGTKIWLTAKNNYKAKAGSGGKIYYSAEPAGKFERSRTTGGNVELIKR